MARTAFNIDIREALAIIGSGLFVFGVWELSHPAAFMCAGALLCTPFIRTMRVTQ